MTLNIRTDINLDFLLTAKEKNIIPKFLKVQGGQQSFA